MLRSAWALWQRCGVVAVFTVLTACSAGRPTVLYGLDVPLQADDYPQVLQTWTRSARLYRNLDSKMFITATYHAPELRRAFGVAFPDIYGHGGRVTKRELVELSGGLEHYHTLFLAVFTPDKRWNDLGKADSIWHLTLRGDGPASVSAAEIIPVKVDENLRQVYPFIGRFDHIYLARFALTDPLHRLVLDAATSEFSLRIASALGSVELHWRLNSASKV